MGANSKPHAQHELSGDGTDSLRRAFNDLGMPKHRQQEALTIVREVVKANDVQALRWHKPWRTNELACSWDNATQLLLWITPSEVHILSDTKKLNQPERPTNWEKKSGKYVGWLLPDAQSHGGTRKPKTEGSTVVCPETNLLQPAGLVCPHCETTQPVQITEPADQTSGTVEDQAILQELGTMNRLRLRDLGNFDVPKETGIYALWYGQQLLYVGISDTDPAKTTNHQAAGVRGRLNTHRRSRVTSDFALGVALRYVVPSLTTAQLTGFGSGALTSRDLEIPTKEWVHKNIAFSVVATQPAVARSAERAAFASGLPGVGTPLLNR